ncbi:MAG: peptide MFS transporter, partial [Xanthobacteraceae bacterium]
MTVHAPATVADARTGELFGHPKGLAFLFATEMWERFSYYGLRPLLILFMAATVANGGYGFERNQASAIVGIYAAFVYLMSLPGGWVADRWLGLRRAIFIGACLISAGHISIGLSGLAGHGGGKIPFFLGLILIVCGTGLLKPNISAIVGDLYPGDTGARRDAGFSIFYMGINLGAFIAPFIVGTLGQRVNWHIGFGCAGIGMVAGLIQYSLGRARLLPALQRLGQTENAPARSTSTEPWWRFTRGEWNRITAIAVLFVFSSVFWGAFEQAASSLNLFADRLTNNRAFGYNFPSTWYQSLNSMF